MTVDELIRQLQEVRETWGGNIPVTLDGPNFDNVELLIPYNDKGGPITDVGIEVTGVQLTTVF